MATAARRDMLCCASEPARGGFHRAPAVAVEMGQQRGRPMGRGVVCDAGSRSAACPLPAETADTPFAAAPYDCAAVNLHCYLPL